MKILQIVPSYKPAYIYGGPIESVARLCESLVANGNIVKVLTTTANGQSELNVIPGEEINVDGVPVIYFKRITKDHTHISPSLWRYLYNHVQEYDIIHIHSWWNFLVIGAALICLQQKKKVVISPRGMLSNYILNGTNSLIKKSIHNLIGKKILGKTFFHATAHSELEECKIIIPNWTGFNLPNILNLPDLSLKKVPNPIFTLIFLSRIHPKKGIENLLKALSQVNFEFKLKIAGTGEETYISELKQKAIALNIANKIEWLGWSNREDKFMQLMQSDLFVLTSYNENFANSVIESLHVGTPVLISNKVGLADFVKSSNLGWVTSLKVNDIKESLNEAFFNKAKRNFIQESAQQTINEYFSEQVLTQQYLSNYENILENH